eukprot:461496-Pelagomonas_calceolata.AAC.1
MALLIKGDFPHSIEISVVSKRKRKAWHWQHSFTMFSCQRELRVLRDDMASYHELIREVSTARLKLLPSLIFPCSIVIWGPERGGRKHRPCVEASTGSAGKQAQAVRESRHRQCGKAGTGSVWKQAQAVCGSRHRLCGLSRHRQCVEAGTGSAVKQAQAQAVRVKQAQTVCGSRHRQCVEAGTGCAG